MAAPGPSFRRSAIGGLGTPTHRAVVDTLNEEEVPDLFFFSFCAAKVESNPGKG